MRPKFFALCAAGWLLASVTHCAVAQPGGDQAPLISSGNPRGPSAASSRADSALGALRQPHNEEPNSGLRDSSAARRDEPAPQQSSLSDESWTVSPGQHTNSTTQSSRTVKHLGDSNTPSSPAANQPSFAPAPRQPTPDQHAAPVQRAPSQAGLAQRESSAPSVPQATVVPAGGAYPSAGTSHLRSHIAQAQFTGAATASVDARRDDTSAGASGDDHRPLKPPTASDPAADEKRSTGTVQMFISVISSLLIVVGLLFGAAWCYRKATPNLTGGLPKQVLQVLGRTPLAPRQQLVLVRFGPKLVLMSNLQGEVRTISEIVDPLEVDRICGMCESSQAGSISDSFRTVLHNIGRTG